MSFVLELTAHKVKIQYSTTYITKMVNSPKINQSDLISS